MRKPIPDRIANAPELEFGLDLYYDAFWDLTTGRQAGLGASPIAYMDMRDYALAHEYDEEQIEFLFHCVRMMDNAYLEFYNKKAS